MLKRYGDFMPPVSWKHLVGLSDSKTGKGTYGVSANRGSPKPSLGSLFESPNVQLLGSEEQRQRALQSRSD